jgi:ABC-type glycerol-3-phosphate transport system permease component
MLQVSARDSGRLTDWTLIYAGIVVSLVIPFTVYFVFQRRLATGITLGAVKG